MRLNFKKVRFVLFALALVGISYYLSFRIIQRDATPSLLTLINNIVFIGLVSVLGSLFIQYLEGGERRPEIVFYVGIMPFLLTLGSLLFFIYYPNLSLFFKIAAVAFYSVLLYTLLLLNNVLLVVESREMHIPVYRVAINWVQIVLLSISISLFTGLLRVQIQPLIQLTFVMITSFVCYNYLLWVYSNDKETRKVKPYEGVVLSGAFTLLTGWGAFFTLFFPAETFLRGIFGSSVFLLGLGYIQLYIKNSLSKKNMWDYLVVGIVFLVIMTVFRP